MYSIVHYCCLLFGLIHFLRFCDTGEYTGWSKKADTRHTRRVSAFLDHPVDERTFVYKSSFTN